MFLGDKSCSSCIMLLKGSVVWVFGICHSVQYSYSNCNKGKSSTDQIHCKLIIGWSYFSVKFNVQKQVMQTGLLGISLRKLSMSTHKQSQPSFKT